MLSAQSISSLGKLCVPASQLARSCAKRDSKKEGELLAGGVESGVRMSGVWIAERGAGEYGLCLLGKGRKGIGWMLDMV